MEYRLPDGKIIESVKRYTKEWEKLSERVLKFFPGYCLASYGYRSGLTFEKRNDQDGIYKVEDRFTLSVDASNCLLRNAIVPGEKNEEVGSCFSYRSNNPGE